MLGESTRPDAKVKPNDEILRVLPTIQSLNHKKINMSLDTEIQPLWKWNFSWSQNNK